MQNNFDVNDSSFLVTLMDRPAEHARFLNTLAYMELCGAQQIARALRVLPATTSVLEHANEEFRHAYFLRKLAQKLSANLLEQFTSDSVFSMRASRNYVVLLQRRIALLLEHLRLTTLLDKTFALYCLTTFAIEQRALPFYRAYDTMLMTHGVAISLKSIISEEASHLAQMHAHLQTMSMPQAMITEALTAERELFDAWLQQIKAAIAIKSTSGE